jgi:predicted MPP superfamily phosphohydrolase
MNVFYYAFTVYGLTHYYFFLKIKSAFPVDSVTSTLLVCFLVFMTFIPVFIHLYAIRGSLGLSKILGYVGFLWIAFIFFFIAASLSLDFYNLAVNLSAYLLKKDLHSMKIASLPAFLISLILSIVFTIYGYFEAKDLRTEHLTVKTSKLPQGINKLTIAQISDLHLGILVRENKMDKVIKAIEKARPDIIVSSGDLLDGEIIRIEPLAERLKNVRARFGKFAVMGNHEFFAGIQRATKCIADAGFTILRNTGTTIDNIINIAGVDDPLGKHNRFKDDALSEPEKDILSRLPADRFTLLLKHSPVIDKQSLGLFDLQLSGHTHMGQIFPGNLIVKSFFYPHSAGYTSLYKGSALYVSRGAGTTLCPVRFLAPPEITIIEIIRE